MGDLSIDNLYFRPLIKQEMMIWEKSKMWPFSCFGYAQNIPSLPGKSASINIDAYDGNV